MKFSHFFAIKYLQCFIYFGIPSGTSKAITNDHICTMSGCIVTLREVDKEDSYIWSYMPQLDLQLKRRTRSVHLYGGCACGGKIKMFGAINTLPRASSQKEKKSTSKSWATSLKMLPNWSESAPAPTAWNEKLLAVKQCEQYVIYLYTGSTFMVTQEKQKPYTFKISPKTVKFNRYTNFAIIGPDLFIVNRNKMAKLEKFFHLLVSHDLYVESLMEIFRTKEISAENFNITVPHANGTLFVVQDTLFVVGGCDKDCEPFSYIYQFDQSTLQWNECGVSSVSRFGASAFVFKDRNGKEVVFLAGGFKGKDTPCSIIEKLFVVA